MLDITRDMYHLLTGITQLLDEIEVYEKKLYPDEKKQIFHGKQYGFIQYQELIRAEADGRDTSCMENPDLSANKMMIFRLAMERGYNIAPYLNETLSEKQLAAMYVINHMTSVDISELASSELSVNEILDQALNRDTRAVKEVKTNMGSMPEEDYLDIVAMQNGFDDYSDMQRQGYSISGKTEKKIQTTGKVR